MPYKEKPDDDLKLYYTIGEVAELFQVNTSLVRFWEKEFDQIRPKKNRKGNRLFTREDIRHFRMIYQLVKEQGYTLDGARKKLRAANQQAQDPLSETIQRLEHVKSLLDQMEEQLP
jgi:DNA-binding transcriptional MerR regulator